MKDSVQAGQAENATSSASALKERLSSILTNNVTVSSVAGGTAGAVVSYGMNRQAQRAAAAVIGSTVIVDNLIETAGENLEAVGEVITEGAGQILNNPLTQPVADTAHVFQTFTDVTPAVTQAAETLVEGAAETLVEGAGQTLVKTAGQTLVETAGQTLVETAGQVENTSYIVEKFTAETYAGPGYLESAGAWATWAGNGIYNGFAWAGNGIWDGLAWAGNGIWGGLAWAGNGIWNGLSTIGNGFLGLLTGGASLIVMGVAGLFRGGAGLTHFTTNVTGTIGNGIADGLECVAAAAEDNPVITVPLTIGAGVLTGLVGWRAYQDRQARLSALATSKQGENVEEKAEELKEAVSSFLETAAPSDLSNPPDSPPVLSSSSSSSSVDTAESSTPSAVNDEENKVVDTSKSTSTRRRRKN